MAAASRPDAEARHAGRPQGALEWIALAVLCAAALGVWWRIYDFSQTRFFTVDEYQYGHATWLVSQGWLPYRDFYEHHFPASYLLHSLVLPDAGLFSERALWLRKLAFGWALAASAALGWATRGATGSWPAGVLAGFLPATFGFGLMSAVDYRFDNTAAFAWLIGLALLERNRVWRRRAVAIGCGALAAFSVLVTQFVLVPVGGTVVWWLAADWLRARRDGGGSDPLLCFPMAFIGSAALVGVLAVGWVASLGVLPEALEYTVAFVFQHEALYHDVPLGEFTDPFLAETWATTWPLLGVAVVSLAARVNRFWLAPTLVALAGGLLIRARFPYHYVLHCYLLILCAVRGFSVWIERVAPPLAAGEPSRGAGRRSAVRCALWLLPLLVLPDQLDFVAHTTTNTHQLAVLDKLQRYTGRDDPVIDSAGAALFRPHAAWYWYHGSAHRRLLVDYFENEYVKELRESRALFWLRDFRAEELPEAPRDYLANHYVSAGGDLWALGFYAPRTRARPAHFDIDVVREDDYYVHPLIAGSQPPSVVAQPDPRDTSGAIAVDGEEVVGGSVYLTEGHHRVAVRPHAPGYVISPLPAEVFRDLVDYDVSHTPLFEYERLR